MYYTVIKHLTVLVEEFERENRLNSYSSDIDGLKSWIIKRELAKDHKEIEHHWEDGETEINPEYVIANLLNYLGKYEAMYSQDKREDHAATSEEILCLEDLKSTGEIKISGFVKKNTNNLSACLEIIKKLESVGMIVLLDEEKIKISEKGLEILHDQKKKAAEISSLLLKILTPNEKNDLLKILTKINSFHHLLTKKSDKNKLSENGNSNFL